MVDDQGVELIPSLWIKDVHQGKLDLYGVICINKAQEIRDSRYMGIDCQPWNVKTVTQNTVRRFPSNSRESYKILECAGYFTGVTIKELAAAIPYVLGLVLVKSGCPDILFKLFQWGAGVVRGIFKTGEQRRCDLVHTLVRALRRQDRSNEELER